MRYFYFYIFILISFIIAVSYFNTYMNTYIESFNSDKQTFILLGDSILKNNAYVYEGKSIDELLIERTNGKTKCLAVDDSKIVDVYSQILKIPEELNTNFTTIFLSVGGNDILSHYVEDVNDSTDTSILTTIFLSYKNLIKDIQKHIPNANIVLLDIYYPDNITYKQYHKIIDKWNNMIYDYGSENNLSVLKISGILTKPDDFSFGIEPSSNGGKKLVESILTSY